MTDHELDDDSFCEECLFVDLSRNLVVYGDNDKARPAGLCRRNPPTQLDQDSYGWPLVQPGRDWCGEFINRNPRFRVGADVDDT